MKPDMDAIRAMSVADRLALVEEIWDSISDDPTGVPVSEAQLEQARRRVDAHE
jgi:putative addiction module component (TIGR02574 family)